MEGNAGLRSYRATVTSPARDLVTRRGRRVAAGGRHRRLTLATRTTPPKPHRQAGPARRWCSTSACGPTRRRSRCAARRISTTPGKVDQAAPIFDRYRLAGGRGRLRARRLAARLRRTSRRWRATHPRSSLVQLELRPRALLARRPVRAPKSAWRDGAARAAGHALLRSGPRTCSTRTSRAACRASCRASSPPPGLARLSPPKQLALPARARDRRAREAPVRRRAAAAGPAGLGAARVRGGRRARSRRPGAAGRRRRRRASTRPTRRSPSRGSARLRSAIPKSQSVRFHLGLFLLWLGSVKKAKEELRLARDAGPDDPAGDRGAPFPRAARRESGPAEAKMGRFGLWRPSAASATVPPS